MKPINTFLTVLLITLLPSLGWSTPLDELMERDGLYYPKFSDVPFTGKVTGDTQGYLKDGRREGVWVTYYYSGALMFKGNYQNGKREGFYVDYYSTGEIREKGNYENGEREGSWVGYFKNGQLSYKGNHKNGKKEGIWFTYNDDGALRSKDNFKDGVKISD